MQASEVKLRRLIEGNQQYVVPLYQRPYSWSEKHWKTLWADVREKAQHADGRPHFFGSIVVAQTTSVPHGVGKFLLIDGQQRMTTIEVFLAAIRDEADASEQPRLRDRIEELYLTNRHEDGDERLKLLPTQDDRPSFRAIIWRQEIPSGQLRKCYEFFREQVGRLASDELDSIHSAIVDRLSLVGITCEEHDNPQLIFESLNAKGEKLTPADLIRNFLLMRVDVKDQDRLFKASWLPVQQALDNDLTEFVRHYLMKSGKILQTSDVYFELKDRLAGATPSEAEQFLGDLHRHGMYYARFVDPQREPDPVFAEYLERIRRLKVTVAYPFLLRIFDALNSGLLTREQVVETLDILESFVIRRTVCGVPSNQLRRMFPPVFDATGGPGPTFIDGLRRQLGGTRCPNDVWFARSLASEPLYATSEKNARLRLMLERMERSFRHREPADLTKTTIEHVLPQTLTPEWRADLGEDATEIWTKLVNTLGNLTLTAYNIELSNKPYSMKRKALIESHLDLNQYFEDVESWNSDSIRERAACLAKRALEIWQDVGRISGEGVPEQPLPQRPTAVRFRSREQPCKNWRDGFVKLVKAFEADQPGLLARLTEDNALFAIVSKDSSRFTRSKAQLGDVFVNTHASAAQLRDWCKKLAERAGLRSTDYGFVTQEDSVQ